MGELSERSAIVTGAGQGVGQGIALALAKAGATVVVSGRSEAKLADTCSKIEAAGGRAIAVPADVKRAADLAALVERAVEETGGLDVLVNNAQEVPLGALAEVSDEAFVAGFESGPLASFRLSASQWSVDLARQQSDQVVRFYHRLAADNPGLLSRADLLRGDNLARAMAYVRRLAYVWLGHKMTPPDAVHEKARA